MKTREFIKEVEKLSLEFRITENEFTISICCGIVQVAYVSKCKIFSADTYYTYFDKLPEELKTKLYNLIDEYTRTPLDEREEPQKYYLRHKWFVGSHRTYLYFNIPENRYHLNGGINTKEIKSQFTQSEIDEIKERFNTNLEDFEQVPVEDYEER